MTYGQIYELRCAVSGKRYVGQTTITLAQRLAKHFQYALKRKGRTHLAAAIRSYGAENFSIHLLESCKDAATLNKRETFWIEKLGTLGSGGYNLTTGGSSRKWSEESKQRFSENHPLRGKTGEQHPAYGHKHTEIAKKSIAAAATGRRHTDEARARIAAANTGENNPWYGKELSEEHRARISASLLAQPHHLRGKKHSPEMIEKFRAAHRHDALTKEHKDKISAALRGVPKSAAHRKRLSEARRKYFEQRKTGFGS